MADALYRFDAEARYRAVIATVADGIVITDRQGLILEFSPACERIFGYRAAEAVGQPVRMLMPPMERGQVEAWMAVMRDGDGRDGQGRGVPGREVLGRRKDGSVFPLRLGLGEARLDGERLFVGTLSDLTDRKSAEAELRRAREELEQRVVERTLELSAEVEQRRRAQADLVRLATTDGLTGLPNRRRLLDQLAQAMASTRSGVGLLLVELSQFKTINTAFGFAFGDELLMAVARRITESFCAIGTVARVGGDKFALATVGLGARDLDELAKMLLDLFVHPFRLGDRELVVMVRIGGSFHDGDPCPPLVMLGEAEVAATKVLTWRRAGYLIHSREISEELERREQIECDLRQALIKGELALVYQPQHHLHDGALAGVEALLRWRRPGGEIPPSVFLPVAENCGLIHALADFTLLAACDQSRRWRDETGLDLRVSVNLSGSQLLREDLDRRVLRALESTDANPASLDLEVTESAAMADPDRSRPALERLASLGVSVAIDDFGSGFTSLAALRRLPVARLKVDRAIVTEMTACTDNAAVAQGIVRLAHSLDKQVVAEGIETADQLAMSRLLGCDEAQGFLLGRPQPAAHLDLRAPLPMAAE